MADSIRQRIMDNLKQRFEAARHDFIEVDQEWSLVTRNPVGKDAMLQLRSLVALYDLKEGKVDRINYQMCTITLATEFYVRAHYDDDDPSKMIGEAMTEVQKTIQADINCGGLSVDIKEMGNEIDLETYGSRIAAGVVMWNVVYRHKTADPTQLP